MEYFRSHVLCQGFEVGARPVSVYFLAVIDRETLRSRLQAAGRHPAEFYALLPGETSPGSHVWTDSPLPAAVLLGVVGYEDDPRVVLTLRTADLRDHAGQISLPGGRVEVSDSSLEAAALREAFEEVGLRPEQVEVLGRLPSYDTPTGFRVVPIVGWIEPPVTFVPDPFEVADVFEVPLAFILDAANHGRGEIEAEGRRRHFHVLDYEDRHIWGATAGILVGFARLVAG